MNFALTGVAGYIAPRHLKAIKATGNRLVAAVDPHDSVGRLDSFFFDCSYFREFERFDRHLEKLRRMGDEHRVHYVSICSPNFLHDAHIRLALRVGAHALCEKPLVLNPWNCDFLQDLEREYGQRVYTVLQLRLHPSLIAVRERLLSAPGDRKHEVVLTYVTARGPWYLYSWKGNAQQSGGLPTNIGIHFFDMLQWMFGAVQAVEVHVDEQRRCAGYLELERARVRWYLSIAIEDLPASVAAGGPTTYRSITVDGEEVEFSEGFADLHTRVYEETLAGRGFGIDDIRPSTQLVHDVREAQAVGWTENAHSMVGRRN
jgi:UDP-N-acetyl-2-amino-2-deoxyglucuronate dehydrogenase